MRKKQVIVGLVAITVLLVAGCGSGPESGDQSSSARQAARADVRWDNDPNGYLLINNNIREPLILFAGSVNNRNILGGIRAESNRRIDYFPAVQEQAGTFLLRAVPESAYRSKGSAISSEDVVFASIVNYDKRQPKITQLNIDFRLGGQAYVIIENRTRMALEVVLDSPSAEVLTTLAPMEMNKRVYLEPSTEGYVFYPIFKYYDRTNDVIVSVEPDRTVARRMNPAIPSQTVSTPTIPFDNTSIGNLSFRFATFIVRNEGREGIFLLEGSNRIRHQNNYNIVNPGTEVFNIFLGDRPQRRVYNIEYADTSLPLPIFEYVPGNTYQLTLRSDGRTEVVDLGPFDKSDLSISLVNQR